MCLLLTEVFFEFEELIMFFGLFISEIVLDDKVAEVWDTVDSSLPQAEMLKVRISINRKKAIFFI